MKEEEEEEEGQTDQEREEEADESVVEDVTTESWITFCRKIQMVDVITPNSPIDKNFQHFLCEYN